MNEFIEKLIGRLKKYQIEYKSGFGELTDETVFRVMENVIYTVNELAEEYKETNIITDFLQYVRDNADNYDADNGWSLSDLIDLSIKFCNAKEYNNDFCEWKKGTGYGFYLHRTSCGTEDTFDDSYKFCPYCGKKIKIAPYQTKGENNG